jgi:hypothetical protein
MGVLAVLAGIGLRIVIMMRASDAGGTAVSSRYGRQLVREYNRSYPNSRLPLLFKLLTSLGAIAVLAGVWIALRE